MLENLQSYCIYNHPEDLELLMPWSEAKQGMQKLIIRLAKYHNQSLFLGSLSSVGV